MANNYFRVSVTGQFVREVLKEYTRRLMEKEAKKNGVKKRQITKALVCKEIIKDMRAKGLI